MNLEEKTILQKLTDGKITLRITKENGKDHRTPKKVAEEEIYPKIKSVVSQSKLNIESSL